MKGAMCQSSPLNQPGAQASAGCFIDWAAAIQVHPCGAGLLRQFRRLDALCDLIGRNLRPCSTAHNLELCFGAWAPHARICTCLAQHQHHRNADATGHSPKMCSFSACRSRAFSCRLRFSSMRANIISPMVTFAPRSRHSLRNGRFPYLVSGARISSPRSFSMKSGCGCVHGPAGASLASVS